MMEKKSGISPSNSVGNLERLNYLIRAFDKHIDRYETSSASLNQKATWTLATATALAAISGFTNRSSILAILQNTASITDVLSIPVYVLMILGYLALLRHVLAAYRPREMVFPVSALNTPKLGPPVSRVDDEGKYVKACWFDIQERHIKPTELEFLSSVLRAHIDSIIEAHLKNQQMGKHVQGAFDLMPLLASLAFILWLLS